MLKTHMNNLIASRSGKSSACLAERCDKTAENPFGFDLAKDISPDEVIVLSLAGEGHSGSNYSNYNGYLKRINEYIGEISMETGDSVRSIIAVIDYGKHHLPREARKLLALQVTNPKIYQAKIQQLPLACQQEYTTPRYVQDIFNTIFLARISSDNGTKKIDINKAAQNIRKIIVITHCHGGYVALKLEDLMLSKMKELGYKKSEQEKILKQLLVLSYAPDCPLGISKTQMISFSSAMDYQTNHGLKIKDYLQRYEFGVVFLPDKMGNVFYCTQIDKQGIEGNLPPVYRSVDPNEWFDGIHKDTSDDTTYLSEHAFPGFRQYDNMSKSALLMRTLMRQIFKKALIHSCNQQKEPFTPLPSIASLAADTRVQRQAFFRIKLLGYCLWTEMQVKTKLLHKNFKSNVKTITLD